MSENYQITGMPLGVKTSRLSFVGGERSGERRGRGCSAGYCFACSVLGREPCCCTCIHQSSADERVRKDEYTVLSLTQLFPVFVYQEETIGHFFYFFCNAKQQQKRVQHNSNDTFKLFFTESNISQQQAGRFVQTGTKKVQNVQTPIYNLHIPGTYLL